MDNEAAQAPGNGKWHTLSTEDVLRRLGTDARHGLGEAEASRRLERYGPNELPKPPARPAWRLFADQFRSLLILILIGAAVLATVIGDVADTLAIVCVVLINASLGFVQEYRAERALAALRNMLAPQAEVRRDGVARMIPAAELVPGDIVLLDAGDRIPADGRVLASHGLEVDESSLTGESHTVGKHAEALAQADLPLAERDNMLYLNTVVTRGRGEMIVTATGLATEMGRLAQALESEGVAKTPLQGQLDHLGKRLALIALTVIVVVAVSGLVRGEPWVNVLMTAIALAVAAIPEGLPAVVTVTLALGMHRMARQKALVKRLAAVETLGCTSVILTDKTGTLTLNQMTARVVYCYGQELAVSGEGYRPDGRIEAPADMALEPILLPFALCNDAHVREGQVVGDPMEGALKVLAMKGGLDPDALAEHLPRIAEVPFDAAYKLMATFHLDGDHVRVFVKGAPEALLSRAAAVLTAQGVATLNDEHRAAFLAANERLAGRGLRVLAAGTLDLPVTGFDAAEDLLARIQDLVLVGLVGLMDPPRPEAREALAVCRSAGITVKMITGDQKITAAAIARELGLTGEVMSGQELDALADGELVPRLAAIGVFARVTPEQKLRLVRLHQALGHVVAMTGDGVNDAPALKNADIGVAMGVSGTDVAKEAATMVLTDDNFATIVRAVREGRTIYNNIVKFVRFQLSTNFGALSAVALAPLVNLPLPFSPIQILWVNIIMDGPPAMALGVDPPRPGLMEEPPRSPHARLLTAKRLVQLMGFGLTMAVGTLALLAWALASHGDMARALTLAFTTFVLFQVFNAFNARVEWRSVFDRNFFSNRALWLALGLLVVIQVLVVHWAPAQELFGTVDLLPTEWLLAVGVAALIVVLEEMRKAAFRIARRWLAG